MVYLLKEQIPDDLLVRLLSLIGFRSLTDPQEIRRPRFWGNDLDEVLAELAPYYIPYAAKKYLVEGLTPIRFITILRHCLRQRGRDILSRETSEKGKKVMCYRLSPVVQPAPPLSFDVGFD